MTFMAIDQYQPSMFKNFWMRIEVFAIFVNVFSLKYLFYATTKAEALALIN